MRRIPLLLVAVLAIAPITSSAESPSLDGVVVAANSSRPLALRTDPAKQVLGALAEYENAYEAQDLSRLSGVWAMGAVERSLVEKSWRACDVASVTLRPGPVTTNGARAKVAFEQDLEVACGADHSTRTSRLEAALERDGSGNWKIASIAGERASNPASALAGQAATGEQREVLNTLDRYAAAFAACDTPELKSLWISNPSERSAVQAACNRDGRPSVSLADAQVSVDDERSFATVDFVQTTSFAARPPNRSQLRATLVKRSGGEWSIWQIKDSH